MYRKTLLIILIILGLFSCRKETTAPINSDFSKTEVHYTKSGWRIKTIKLDIYGNGTVNAYLMKNYFEEEKAAQLN